MKTPQEKEKAIQELKEQALEAIVNKSNDVELNRIRDEYTKLMANYGVGDIVWIAVEDGCPREYIVRRVMKHGYDSCERSSMYDNTISYVLELDNEQEPDMRVVAEKAVFPNKAALIENMKALIELLED